MSPDEQKMHSCPQCGAEVTGLENACPQCGKKFDDSIKVECPFCGEFVFPGATSCPGCHIDFTKVDMGRFAKLVQPAKPKNVDDSIDQLLGELHQFMKTETDKRPKHLVCLNCGKSLDGIQKKCPSCNADLTRARSVGCAKCQAWVTLEDDFCPDCHSDLRAARQEPIVQKTRRLKQASPVIEIGEPKVGKPQAQCSSCGNLVGIEDVICPFCGVPFEASGGEAVSSPQPGIPPKPSIEVGKKASGKARRIRSVGQKPHITTPPPIRSKVSKSGLSNGIGETNGLSFVNGKRSPDNKAFVNGTGVSNGLKRSRRGPGTRSMGGLMTNWRFLTILVAIAVVISTFMIMSYSQSGSPRAIDGKFSDWKDSIKLGARTQSTSPSINVQEWSIEIHDLDLFLYARTQSNLMMGQNVESVFLYVDSDSSSSTGYRIDQLGAEYLLEITGWNSSVRSTSLSTYSLTSDQMDWNSWRSIGDLSVALGSNQIEAMAPLPKALPTSARFLLVTQDQLQRWCSSYDVPAEGGLLIVQQVVPDNVSASGIIPQNSSVLLFSLVFTCEGTGGSVESVLPELSGVAQVAGFTPFSIEPGGKHIVDILVDATEAQAGHLATGFVKESDVTSSFSDIQLIGEGASAYVKNPPKRIVIDGAFGDWAGRTVSHDESVPTSSSPNVKIDEIGAANDSAGAYFYLRVDGQMCSGTYIPAIRIKPSGTQGGGGILTPLRKTAEDIMNVFIDSDRSPLTGLRVSLDSGASVIGADQLVEVRGLFGKITSTTHFDYDAGDWVPGTNSVEAAIDDHQMEISVNSAGFGQSTLVDFAIQTSSWRGEEDIASCSVLDLSQDPWAIRTNGADYRSSDGVSWSSGASITLSGGDTVVDMAPSWDKLFVFAVTNSGRVYSWQVGVSTTWGSNVTDTVNGTANIVAIAPFNSGAGHGGYVLASDGRYWSTNKLDGTVKAWTYGNKVASGITDFADIEYQKTGANYYVVRSTANTAGYWASGPTLSLWHFTSATGSTSPQTHVLHIGASGQQNKERVLVLCENGNIRDSSDGGVTWSALGNLPAPGGGNTSKYIGMDFDPSGYLWVITDSGWCFKSTDTTTFNTFTSTGRATAAGGLTAITCPIPEFPTSVIPLLFMLGIMLVVRHVARRRLLT